MPQELREATPYYPAPADASSKAWVGFGAGQTGQLSKANEDKRIAWQICNKVEAANKDAREQAKKRTKRWWQF